MELHRTGETSAGGGECDFAAVSHQLLIQYMLQKWNRLYKLFHPRPEIGKDEAGPLCLVNGPRLAYGWAFSRSDIRQYADFHHVNMPLQEYLSEKLGKTLVRYGALSETDAQDEELLYLLPRRMPRSGARSGCTSSIWRLSSCAACSPSASPESSTCASRCTRTSRRKNEYTG